MSFIRSFVESMGHLWIFHLAALLIGVSKAGFGGGSGILATPLLAMVIPAKASVGLTLPLLVATDVFSLFYYWGKWNKQNLKVLMPTAVIGILIGGQVLSVLPDIYLKRVIGAIACLFVLWQILQIVLEKRSGEASPLPDEDDLDRDTLRSHSRAMLISFRPRHWHGLGIGLLAGIVSTLTHAGGTMVSMYLLPQKLSNREFVGTTTALFFLVNLLKVGTYVPLGLITPTSLQQDVFLLPTILAGTLLGIWLNRHISRALFTRIVLIFILIAGLKLLI